MRFLRAAILLAAAGAGIGAVAPTREETKVAKMENGFALDLYHRVAAGEAGQNLFFSPYSIYAVLAMAAEGARGETADEIGRALHLAADLRRRGVEASSRPWDFAPLHAGLGGIAAGLQAGAGAAPAKELRAESLRKEMAAAHDAARHASQRGEWMEAGRQNDRALALATELNALLPEVNRYELRIANALWCDARYALAPEFVRTLAAHYGTGDTRAVDFRHAPEDARGRINGWVAEQTAQRIRDLLPPGSVDAATRLVLANAIWFKGEWAEPFDSSATRDAPFRHAGGRDTPVPLMQHELGGGRYAAFRADGSRFPTPREIGMGAGDDASDPKLYPGDGGFQVAELPYKGGTLSMLVLLPHSPAGLAALERRLEAGRLADWIGALERRRTNVFLPRFGVEQGRELREPLRAMGMVRAFVDPASGRGAQFQGMTSSTNRDDALFVSAVVHKAFLEVNEKGTEAAAATAGVMTATGLIVPTTRPFVPTFRADRPFLFLIRDTSSGAILFMGRLTKP